MSQNAIRWGCGRHFDTLTKEEKLNTKFWTLLGICPAVISLAVPKFAVVVMLSKLLNPSKFHKWFLWWMATWSFLTSVVVIGLLLGQCKPMEALWNSDVKGDCMATIFNNYSVYVMGK